jgi:hypothetical protein
MDENAKLIESLLEKATDYGKTSFELYRLKALDKTSDLISSLIPHSVTLFLLGAFMLFLNLGLAFWLGEIMGKIFYGFLVISAFYAVIVIIMHFFLHKWLKKIIGNYFIKQVLK